MNMLLKNLSNPGVLGSVVQSPVTTSLTPRYQMRVHQCTAYKAARWTLIKPNANIDE